MIAFAEPRQVANAPRKTKMLRFHKVTRRISRRFGPDIASNWLSAVTRFQGSIDENLLRKALASGNLASIDAAVGSSNFGQIMRRLEDPFARAAGAAGTASADILEANGFGIQFNAVHPNVVQFARDQSAALVVNVQDDVREAIRTVVAIGAQEGLTTVQQARAIREVVGLPPNWVDAPFEFEKEIRAGQTSKATSRRISAADKQKIRSRINAGTVDDAFVASMREKYSASLLNRRAINIARTESIRSAHGGLQESWQQGVQQGVIGKESRRFWLVTPDSQLSEEHATIPSMNPLGRGMTEPFSTTEGFFMYPPSRPNCRCGVGLQVAPGTGVPVAEVEPEKVAKKAIKRVKKVKRIKRARAPAPEKAAAPTGVAAPPAPTGVAAPRAPIEAAPPTPTTVAPGAQKTAGVDTIVSSHAQANYTARQLGVTQDLVATGIDDVAKAGFTDLTVVNEEGVRQQLSVLLRGMDMPGGQATKYAFGKHRIFLDGIMTKDTAALNRMASALRGNEWMAGNTARSLIHHELGHALNYQSIGTKRFLTKTLTNSQRAFVRKHVSMQAGIDRSEFIAETFSGLMRGQKYRTEILEMYRKWGGPISKQWDDTIFKGIVGRAPQVPGRPVGVAPKPRPRKPPGPKPRPKPPEPKPPPPEPPPPPANVPEPVVVRTGAPPRLGKFVPEPMPERDYVYDQLRKASSRFRAKAESQRKLVKQLESELKDIKRRGDTPGRATAKRTQITNARKELADLRNSQAQTYINILAPKQNTVQLQHRTVGYKRTKIGNAQRQVANDGIDQFKALISNRWLKPTRKGGPARQAKVKQTDVGRAFYRNQVQTSFLPANGEAHTVVHELGHWLEYKERKVHNVAAKFFRERTKGEAARPYGPKGEVAKYDKFMEPYMGRVYPRGDEYGEIISMGLQLMVKDPFRFMVADEEYFWLIMRIMYGAI